MGIQNLKLIGLMLVVLLSANYVYALGVSSPYWEDHPLKMYPGQTRDVAFTLVNRVDAETATAFVSLDESAGIAKIISGTEYTVLPGTTDTKIILRISIPEETSIGDSYGIAFSVRSGSEGEGQVQLSVGYNVDFPVEVVEKSAVPSEIEEPREPQGLGIIWIIVLAAIVILVIIYLIFVRKGK